MPALNDFLAELEDELRAQGKIKAADPFITSGLDTQATKKEQADEFIRQVIDETKMIKMARKHITDSPSGDITKLNITGYVTRAMAENTQFTETRRPSNSSLTYTTVKTVSAIDISGEVSEDNIEGKSGRDTILGLMTTSVGNDMEKLAIEGDTSAAGSDDETALVASNDGWHVLTGADDGAHIVSAGNKRASYALLSDMVRAMPTKWKKRKDLLRFFVSDGAAQCLIDEWAARSTNQGDAYRAQGEIGRMLGIAIEIIPMLPEDLAASGTDSTGSFIWLSEPTNFIYVVQRDITVEFERIPRYDREEITMMMRTDFLVEEADRVVKATDVLVDTTAAYYGA